jgi:hypothetical protein
VDEKPQIQGLSGERFWCPRGQATARFIRFWINQVPLVRLPHRPEDPSRVHQSVQSLEADIRDWIQQWNENLRPFA